MGERDWIDLAQDRDQWRALANTVMNLRVLCMGGEHLDCLGDCWFLKKDSATWSKKYDLSFIKQS
jgi:hypothetical protein